MFYCVSFVRVSFASIARSSRSPAPLVCCVSTAEQQKHDKLLAIKVSHLIFINRTPPRLCELSWVWPLNLVWRAWREGRVLRARGIFRRLDLRCKIKAAKDVACALWWKEGYLLTGQSYISYCQQNLYSLPASPDGSVLAFLLDWCGYSVQCWTQFSTSIRELRGI